MNNKEELEKYKKELADLEVKDKQQNTAKQKKPLFNLDKRDKKYLLFLILLAPLGVFMIFAGPAIFLALGMYLTDNPRRFKLPYNGIDFKKIAYINNQFIMYGVDYDEPKEPKLAIFNSVDGKTWTKATIVNNDTDINVLNQSRFIPRGTFAYFNGNCYLFGVSPKPLIAKGNCSEWQGYENNLMKFNDKKYFTVLSVAMVQNKMYITTEEGLYHSSDGINWQQESIPCVEIRDKCRQIDNVGGVLFGNGQLILSGSCQDGKAYIYSKDVNTGQWKYQLNPGIGYIIRGEDRFVGLSDTMGWVYTDSKQVWESSPIIYDTHFFSYGAGGQYIGLTGYLYVEKSRDGKYWQHIPAKKKDSNDRKSINDLACNQTICYGVGDDYYLTSSRDGETWEEEEFNLRNPKLAWYRRFFK